MKEALSRNLLRVQQPELKPLEVYHDNEATLCELR